MQSEKLILAYVIAIAVAATTAATVQK